MHILKAACAAALLAVASCGQATYEHATTEEPAPYAATDPAAAAPAQDTERYEHAAPNPIRIVAEAPISTFSIDVDTAAYANVRRFLNEGRLPPQDAVRIEELINYFDYDYTPPAAREQPFSSTVSVIPSPWAEGRQLVHIGLQGYDVARAERPPLNLVLLIDVSGSMDEPNKLPLALDSFRMLAEQLTARDRLSIVVYAGAAGAVLEPTSGDDTAAIRAALNQLKAGGSTAGGEGLRLAYAMAGTQLFGRGGQSRHPRHRRRLQCRHHRHRAAAGLRRAQARERHLSLRARLWRGQL
ncbi:MAG: vWA domain-containing protein [Vitreimonas sp.]